MLKISIRYIVSLDIVDINLRGYSTLSFDLAVVVRIIIAILNYDISWRRSLRKAIKDSDMLI